MQLQEEAAGELLWGMEVNLLGIMNMWDSLRDCSIEGYRQLLQNSQEGKEGKSVLM